MTSRGGFRQDDVSRAVKGARNAGIRVDRIEISPADGKIVIVTETSIANHLNEVNPWDEEFADK